MIYLVLLTMSRNKRTTHVIDSLFLLYISLTAYREWQGILQLLRTYERGMTVMNFRIWRKKTERAVTRQHTSLPFIGFVMVYWRGHKGITLPGNDNDVAVEKKQSENLSLCQK